VQTAVILVSYVNKLRLEGRTIREATREAALLRLRPIMMTALVACLGLLPAAMSSGVGSDTLVFKSEATEIPVSWSHDGQF
jgi:cobalt-zinc-cadmium resistance protein CzcA